MTFFAFILLVNIQGMGRRSQSAATTKRQVPESAREADPCQPTGVWLHSTVLNAYPSSHLWEAGQAQCEQARPGGREAATCLLETGSPC